MSKKKEIRLPREAQAHFERLLLQDLIPTAVVKNKKVVIERRYRIKQKKEKNNELHS